LLQFYIILLHDNPAVNSQAVRWSGGQVVRWSGGQVVRWSGGQVVRWSGGQVVAINKRFSAIK